jgi:hypothetical protein
VAGTDSPSEIDERKLYLERALPSMFEFCVGELRFSEDIAYNRNDHAYRGQSNLRSMIVEIPMP